MNILKLIFLFLLIFKISAAKAKEFKIYAFLPWTAYKENGIVINTNVKGLQDHLENNNIHFVDVVYPKRFTDENGQISEEKIKQIANSAAQNPKTIISFDDESGDHFKPDEILPRLEKILMIYHEYNRGNPAGFYGVAPQNTYKYKNDIARYDELNSKYITIAQMADFLSPVLYNYDGRDFEKWRQSAIYNIKAAKNYKVDKPIIPYISPIFTSGNFDEELNEGEMKARLDFLYSYGADGVIVWGSSSSKIKQTNHAPIFDANYGWSKALSDFARSHKQ